MPIRSFCLMAVPMLLLASALTAGDPGVHLVPVGRYDTGTVDGGAAEIVSYHANSRCLFSVNTQQQQIDMISIQSPAEPRRIGSVQLAEFGSVPTSVSARDDVLAASILAKQPRDKGRVVFFTPDGKILGSVEVGYHPDMVLFSPDGNSLLVANEGEPTGDGSFDGEGSITILAVPRPLDRHLTGLSVRTADFTAWNDGAREFPRLGRRVDSQVTVSQDLEPEGLAFAPDSQMAYASLQEANIVAVIDLRTARVERLIGLGYKDHAVTGNELDVSGHGELDTLRAGAVLGMYQPDNLGCLRVAGRNYLLLANEGDARTNQKFLEEIAVKDAKLDAVRFPNAADLQSPDELGNLIVATSGDTDGDGDLDQLYSYGGRSLSIIDTQGELVYDSGHELETVVGQRIARHRQAHPDAPLQYAVKKGPEPEGLAIGTIGDHTYAFLGLERDNGIATFDVSNPRNVTRVDYVNPAEQATPAGIAGDSAPEGLCFVPAQDSPTGEPLLAVANEASGSVTLYVVRPGPRPPVQNSALN